MRSLLFALLLVGCPGADAPAPDSGGDPPDEQAQEAHDAGSQGEAGKDAGKAGENPNPDEAGESPDPGKAGENPDPDKEGEKPDPDEAGENPDPDKSGENPDPGPDPTAEDPARAAAPDAGKPPPDAAGLYGWDDNVGAVARDADGSICWKLAGDPPDGAPVTVVRLQPEVSVYAARVAGRCDPGPDPILLGDTPAPRTKLTVEGLGSDPFVGIAVLGGPSLKADGDAGVGDIDRDGKDEALVACKTGEGLMLSAWKGKPRKGDKVWSSYHFLGYEVEPNCTDAEVN